MVLVTSPLLPTAHSAAQPLATTMASSSLPSLTDAPLGTPPPVVRLCAATLADLDAIHRVELTGDSMFLAAGHPEFTDAPAASRAEATCAVEQGGGIVVARLEQSNAGDACDHVVGFVWTGDCGEEMRVRQLSVDPKYGRRGIGKLLIGHAIATAKEARKSLVLDTQDDIPWNRPWYERLGFAIVPPAEWTPAMHQVVEEQTAEGLRWDTRVHMRLAMP